MKSWSARPILWVALAAAALVLSPDGRAAGPGGRRQTQQIERLLAAGDVEQAEKLLDPALKAAPDQAKLIQLRAELLFLQGQYDQAVEVSREAVRRNRTSLRAKALRNLIAST